MHVDIICNSLLFISVQTKNLDIWCGALFGWICVWALDAIVKFHTPQLLDGSANKTEIIWTFFSLVWCRRCCLIGSSHWAENKRRKSQMKRRTEICVESKAKKCRHSWNCNFVWFFSRPNNFSTLPRLPSKHRQCVRRWFRQYAKCFRALDGSAVGLPIDWIGPANMLFV